MAIKLVRKKRKNADGSYDIVHYETQAKVVWFEDGESVQEKFENGKLGGDGAMLQSDYDRDKTVQNAGGIVGYVDGVVGVISTALDGINGEVV